LYRIVQTDVLSTTTERHAATIAQAITRLRNGDVVGLPTETVYGLAADALKAEAVVKIFEAKDRPRFDPLIVHLPDLDWLNRVAIVDDEARQLVEALGAQFWPGPLTMVLPRREIVPEIVTAGLETVAVRISAHPVFAEVVRGFGSPLAAPSANRFGRISPTSAQHVLDELEGRIPLVVDGGPTVHGIESTIVALRNGRIEVLRRGPITSDQLEPFGQVVVPQAGQRLEAPGQLPSHYAPETRLILVEELSSFTSAPNQKCGVLAWSSAIDMGRFAMVRQLSSRQDLREAAANLFRYLRELDQAGLDLIVAERLPDRGLGAAINDRLARAAR
jgi:L-threonylcarbamoyladenylate synthase